MNKWIGMGRLTRDPEVRYSTDAQPKAVATFTLAVDRKYSKERAADFIRCVAFDKTAEVIEKYTKQGTKIVVEGHIQTGSYTNKEGQKVYTTDIMVEAIDFAESKRAESEPAPATDSDGFMNLPIGIDEELPFV